MSRKLRIVLRTVAALGLVQGLRYLALRYLLRRRHSAPRRYKLRAKETRYPLEARSDTSDFEVFYQIFVVREYQPLLDLKDVKLVIDCGANVGYSSAYFLTQFPECRVIAIEPDPENFAQLQRNLAPYGARAKAYQAGIWTHPAELVITEQYGDGRHWARQVRECRPEEQADVTAVDIASLVRDAGDERISLLKMDIEGTEALLFSDPRCREWLPRVDAMAIELHDDTSFGPATKPFQDAIKSEDFDTTRCGELTLCIRRSPARSV